MSRERRMEENRAPGQTLQERGRGSLLGAPGRWLVGVLPWHVRAFLIGNVGLSVANVFTGRPWWAFWPLLATGLLLAVHYLVYKAAAVDEGWVDARVEELNLKSYDRSHIEDLKARHGGIGVPGTDDRNQQVP
jgi:hypothetical protein